MLEHEKQELFLETVGKEKAEKIQRLWKNTWPKYCSLNDEYPKQHTKEEVFYAKAKEEGISKKHIDMFMEL